MRCFSAAYSAVHIAMYATALPALVGLGARIPLSWLHETVNIPLAADDEPILQSSASAAPSAADPPPAPAPATRRASLAADPVQADPAQAAWAAQLAQRCDPIVGSWIEQIAALVNDPAISTPAELAGRMVEMYGGLPSDEMSKIMQIADLTAQLSGRFDVINEAGGGA